MLMNKLKFFLAFPILLISNSLISANLELQADKAALYVGFADLKEAYTIELSANSPCRELNSIKREPNRITISHKKSCNESAHFDLKISQRLKNIKITNKAGLIEILGFEKAKDSFSKINAKVDAGNISQEGSALNIERSKDYAGAQATFKANGKAELSLILNSGEIIFKNE